MKKVLLATGLLILSLTGCSQSDSTMSDKALIQFKQEAASAALSLVSGSGAFGVAAGNPMNTLVIKNQGDAATTVLTPVIVGTNANTFSVVLSYCSRVINPNTQCQMRVRFNGQGQAAGSYAATLTLGELAIPLSAEIVAPAEESLSLLVQDGGSTLVDNLNYGTLSSPAVVNKILKITNTGVKPTGLLSIELADTSFVLNSNTCVSSLNPGKSCQVRLILLPGAHSNGVLASALTIKKANAVGGGGGALDANTTFLMHADGSVSDASPSAIAVTNTNVSFGSGKFGQGLDFSTGSGQLVFPEGYNFGFGDFTLDFWVKHNPSGNARQVLFSQANATRDGILGGSPGWMVSIVDGNRLEFMTNQLFHGFPTIREAAVNFNDGQWHHVSLQRDGDRNYIMFHVDGQLSSIFYPPNSSGNNLMPVGTRLRVGMSGAVDPSLERFSGQMDEIRISNVDRYDYYDSNFGQSNNPEHNTTYALPMEPYGGDGIVRSIEIALTANIQLPLATGAAQNVDLNFYADSALSNSFAETLADGESVNKIFVIKNEGSNSSSPLSLSLSGADASKFKLLSNTCLNRVLAPGASCSVRVIFSSMAQSAGEYQASLNIGDQSLPLTVTVTGGGGSSGDLKLLMHFNGDLADASGNNKIVAHHSGATYPGGKFGSSVAVGESAPAMDTAPNDPDFKFGTGDFTIDLWINITGSGSTNHFVGRGNSGLGGWDLYSQSGSLVLNNWTGPNANSFSVPSTIVSPNTWYHVAISRHQGTVYLYVNGMAYNAGAFPEFDETDPNYYFHVGGYTQGNLNWNMGGNIDELRVIKGVDIYGGQNFTPPASPY